MKPSRYILLILLLPGFFPNCGIAQVSEPSRQAFFLDALGSTLQPIDTQLLFSFRHHPLFADDYSFSELGNTGSVALVNRFDGIPGFFELPFLRAARIHTMKSKPVVLHRIKSPFSIINFNSGGTEDRHGQTVRALYTRNFSRHSNLTATLRYYSGPGHYARQETALTDVAVHYAFEKDHYKLYSHVSSVSQKQQENGGLRSDDDLASSRYPELLTVRLDQANSKNRFLNLMAIQEFNLSEWPRKSPTDTLTVADSLLVEDAPDAEKSGLTLEHRFALDSEYRIYQDGRPLSGFYAKVLSDSTTTHDSVGFLRLDNQFLLSYRKFKIRGEPVALLAGLRPSWYRFGFEDESFSGADVGWITRAKWTKNHHELSMDAEWSILGRRSGDLDLRTSWLMQLPMKNRDARMRLTLKMLSATPNPLLNRYSSNHFRWDQSFMKQSALSGEAGFEIPDRRFSIHLDMHLVNHWIWFDSEAMPQQTQESGLISGLKLNKHFIAGPFNAFLHLTAQYSSDENIPLPIGIGGLALWMHHDLHFKVTGGRMELEYGIDSRFTTSWKGYAWMPATGLFYLQQERMLGNYPMLDLFAQVKIKRTRIFIQYNHLLQPLFPGNYFAALHHPYQQAHLKYGLFWHFYD